LQDLGHQAQASEVPGETLQGADKASRLQLRLIRRSCWKPLQLENRFQIARQQERCHARIQALQQEFQAVRETQAIAMSTGAVGQANHHGLRRRPKGVRPLQARADALQAHMGAGRQADGGRAVGGIDEAKGAAAEAMK
jgi:hypothetical protein